MLTTVIFSPLLVLVSMLVNVNFAAAEISLKKPPFNDAVIKEPTTGEKV